jgi:zinc transport system substrate-binding protein
MKAARNRRRCGALVIAIAWVALLVFGGCGETREGAETASGASTEEATVAVSSPYLEAAVRELLGRDVRLARLAGPTMCPGHFDMRPSQLRDLAHCSLLVRFDFQSSLDEKLKRGNDGQRRVVAVRVPGGLCVPETYLAACQQVAEHLVSAETLTHRQAEERLGRLRSRLDALRREVAKKVDDAELRGIPVLASRHQADFCRWLGLRVVGEISAGDAAGISDIEKSIKDGQSAGVRLIVANEPEGRQSADALADRFRAKVVVFANFPSLDLELPFDAMVRGNVATILDAAKPEAGQL